MKKLIRVLLMVLLIRETSFGQNAGLMLMPNIPFFNAAGTAPLAGGKLCTLVSGTTSSLNTYATKLGSAGAANSNPITLDSSGRAANVWLSPLASYRLRLYAAGTGNTCNGTTVGTLIWSQDDVYGPNVSNNVWYTGTATGTSYTVTLGNNSTHLVIGQISVPSTFISGGGQSLDMVSGGDTSSIKVFSGNTANENYTSISQTTTSFALNGFLLGTATAVPYDFKFNDVTRMRLQSTGELDLGTTTAFGSSALLNVAGKTVVGTTTTAGSLVLVSAGSGNVGLTLSAAAPTVSSGFGTAPSTSIGTTAAFRLNVGTGGIATGGVIAMNATATTGWNCDVKNITALAANVANSRTVQTASSTTTVTVQNQTISTGAALVWTASDILAVSCVAF